MKSPESLGFDSNTPFDGGASFEDVTSSPIDEFDLDDTVGLEQMDQSRLRDRLGLLKHHISTLEGMLAVIPSTQKENLQKDIDSYREQEEQIEAILSR